MVKAVGKPRIRAVRLDLDNFSSYKTKQNNDLDLTKTFSYYIENKVFKLRMITDCIRSE